MEMPKQNVDSAYYSVSTGPFEEDDQPLRPQFELGDHPQLMKPRRLGVTILVQLLSALWLVPIITLLYLNLTGRIIGPSAWCPRGNCWVDAFNPMLAVPLKNIAKFNKDDHNLLGGLQLVAKALEIWFIAIAAAFVYLVTMGMAAKPGGLPIGYLTRPTEFAELLNLFDPLLWSSAKGSDRRVSHRAWFLILLSAILCILCNLMGPATAVLAIPSLQWIGTKHIGNRRFVEINAGEPPGIDPNSWFSTQASYLCTAEQLLSHNYSCALDTSGHAMDAWLESCLSSHGNLGYTQALDLTFQVNSTAHFSSVVETQQNYTDFVFWVPGRQTLSNLTYDRSVIRLLSEGVNISWTREAETNWSQPTDPIETYTKYNKSLGLEIERNSPVTGFISTSWFGQYNAVNQTFWTVGVDASRQIRCYNGYIPGWTPTTNSVANLYLLGVYLKCIRIGSGWSELNKAASFYVSKEFDATSSTSKQDQAQALGVVVNVYSSDRAVFFPNGKLPSWLPEVCLTPGNLTNPSECDFERLFSTPAPPRVANRVMNVNTIEMWIGNGTSVAMLVSDFVAFNNFTTYSLDVSPLTNPLGFVHAQYLPKDNPLNTSSIHVDPNWILAGWSVGDGGTIQLGRPSASILLDVMTSLFNYGLEATWNMDMTWNHVSLIDYIAFVPVAHSLSLIDYKTEVVSDQAQPDSDHPLLFRTGHMYVWGYFMASRTAIMGVVVTLAGCLVVLTQLYLGFKDTRRYRSPTQLLVAALEHMPRGEFEGKRHNERAMARVPFHIEENDTLIVRFSHGHGHGRSSSGQSKYSPGQSGYSPVQSRYSPGQGVFSPWQGGYSPGQSRYSSLRGGYSPGQSRHSSLQGGFSPWQGGGTMASGATTRDFIW